MDGHPEDVRGWTVTLTVQQDKWSVTKRDGLRVCETKIKGERHERQRIMERDSAQERI